MKRLRYINLTGVLIIVILMLTSCASSNRIPKRQLYTAHNFWIENPAKVYGINYKTGKLIPCGTPVELIRFERGLRPYFIIIFSGTGEEVRIHLTHRFHPGLTIADLAEHMLTIKTFEEFTKDLTADEIQAIQDAKVLKGMSKKAVRISLGYPPTHHTESLSLNTWKYWKNKGTSFVVEFDEDGKVKDDVVY